ncbi:hypothetical protein ACEE49_01565 [[Pasteurella] aerogenes]|nr:hypothetical protein [[Pasteurella] aerogenes]
MKKSTALFVSALAMATAVYAQNPQSTKPLPHKKRGNIRMVNFK